VVTIQKVLLSTDWFTSTSSYNYGQISDAAYDAAYPKKLLQQMPLDPAAAAEDYKTAEAELYNNAHYNPLLLSAVQNHFKTHQSRDLFVILLDYKLTLHTLIKRINL